MKKTIGILVLGLLLALGLSAVFYRQPGLAPIEEPEPANQAVHSLKREVQAGALSFVVLGDIHTNIGSFQTAINDLPAINPSLTALVLNGDTVDQGLQEQYKEIQGLLAKNQGKLPPVLIKNIGNHEFFNYNVKENTPQDVRDFIGRYLAFSGEQKVYHDTWIKGYHFISLGSEDGNSKTLDSVRAYISPEQQRWLTEKLAENYEKGKPIFVFLHQHLHTNSGGWVGTDQAKELHKILTTYPEVILFSSHTHRPLDPSIIMTKQPFTTVHTGAVHYTIVADGKGGRTREPQVNGVYVEVLESKIIIKGRDMKGQQWVVNKEIPR